MSKSNTFENDILKMIYNATPIANLADNAAASPLTSIAVALHTADPGEAGTQQTSECAYGSYARVNVLRSSSGWTVSGNTVNPVATITFPEATSGNETVTHWSTGPTGGGATKIFHSGVIGTEQGPFTATTADNITVPGHSLVVDDRVAFNAVEGSTLPTGITEGTVYWVKTVSGDVITISTTQGGAVVDITVAGDGVCRRVTPIAVTTGVTPSLTTGTTIKED